MEPINRYSLEDFAERHRADFDLHEPPPEAWVRLAAQLDGTALAANAPVMRIAAVDLPTDKPASVSAAPLALRTQWARWQRYGLAAALALLIAAAGLGEAWKADHSSALASNPNPAADAAGYETTHSTALAASAGGPAVDARLDTAVHGMERYYSAQLTSREVQLNQLAPAVADEWTQELVGLDSSYQQLKRELPRHPQPEVVLTAMNRNLQIRLDILDRQLELHGADPEAVAATGAGSEYALADSRNGAAYPASQRNDR